MSPTERQIVSAENRFLLRISELRPNTSEAQSHILKYTNFMKIREEKIDIWHRQFENMTIEDNGILRIVSDFDVLEHYSLSNQSNLSEIPVVDMVNDDPDGKVNMLFATSFIKTLIDQYQGRV